jgi:hypothetical protein
VGNFRGIPLGQDLVEHRDRALYQAVVFEHGLPSVHFDEPWCQCAQGHGDCECKPQTVEQANAWVRAVTEAKLDRVLRLSRIFAHWTKTGEDWRDQEAAAAVAAITDGRDHAVG